MLTGWAVRKHGKIVAGGFVDFKKGNSEGMAYQAYLGWLRTKISRYAIDEIIFEDVAGLWVNKYAQRYYFGFRAMTVMVAAYYGCKVFGYNQKSTKKWVLGNGNADKVDIMTYYRKQGIHVENDDHGDALLLLDYHDLFIAGKVTLPVKKKKPRKKATT